MAGAVSLDRNVNTHSLLVTCIERAGCIIIIVLILIISAILTTLDDGGGLKETEFWRS